MEIDITFNKTDGTSTTLQVLGEHEETIDGKSLLIWDIAGGYRIVAHQTPEDMAYLGFPSVSYIGHIQMPDQSMSHFLAESLELVAIGMFRQLQKIVDGEK
jgi:hypothetical protein